MTTITDAQQRERTAHQFAGLCRQLHVEPDRRGEAWIDCPWCGKTNKHFSFSERGYKCFVCGKQGRALWRLAEQLCINPDVSAAPRTRPQESPKPRQWQANPARYVDDFCGALDRVTAWQAYKPLTLESIQRYRLGVGALPSSRCQHRRLIVPVYAGGAVVALHGRAFRPDDTAAKWLTAGGSTKCVLFNADALRPGCDVVVVENMIDAILFAQVAPDVVPLAGGGVGWQPEWTAQIAAIHPRRVAIYLDNDLAGWPNPWTYQAMRAAWLAAHPDKKPPEPAGPKIAQALLDAGVRRVTGPDWPRGTPAKWDVGSDLMRRLK